MSKTLKFLGIAMVGALGISAQTASAGTPSGDYAVFQHCPYQSNDQVTACVVATITSGSFKIGKATVPINKPIVLQGGVNNIAGLGNLYVPVDGAPAMSPTALDVPGGLLGLMEPDSTWPGPLVQLFWHIVNTVNDVTATAEPVGPAQANLINASFPPPPPEDPTVIKLQIRIHLQNPFLGNTCYIGSASHPIVLNLVANTTSPPPPNSPISGVPAVLSFVNTTNPDGQILMAENGTLVDNSFAVPKAEGCGNTLLPIPIITPILQGIITAAVNLKEGLPAAAGKNTAIMIGDTAIGPTIYVQASEQ
ncbi:hypothetical protein [Dyella sp. 2RAB6]|uniref:hypothetical protein n=1 Tax=Dyella sp. 2RAB6 TaxID=3232992 RepID=UPI003F900538